MWARVVMHGEFKLNMNSCLTLGQVRCGSADGRRYSAVRSGQQGTDADRHGAPRALGLPTGASGTCRLTRSCIASSTGPGSVIGR